MENNPEIDGLATSNEITPTAPQAEGKRGLIDKLMGLFGGKDKTADAKLPTDAPALGEMSPSIDSGTPLSEVASPVQDTSAEINSSPAQPDANAALKDLNVQMGAQVGNPFPGAIPPQPTIGEAPSDPSNTAPGSEKAA